MNDIHKQLDLSLLRSLDVLVSEAHVSRAAERLEMSQPAMSRVLARLRERFGDPILVRGISGMQPTPRALALAEISRRILHDVEQVLGNSLPFEPSTCSQSFRIIATDYTHAVFIPQLAAALQEQAPAASLSIKHPIHPRALLLGFEEGEIDLAVGHLEEPPGNLRFVPLFEDSVSCLMRSDHAYLSGPADLQAFAELRHILVTPSGFGHFQSNVDRALAAVDLKRRVGMLSQHFMAAPFVAAKSDMAVLMPRRLAEHYSKLLGLAIVDPPLDITPYKVYMYWHERSHLVPAHRWLRGIADECGRSPTFR